MIHSINLKNFQIHKDTTIEFGPGLNSITGLSRQGKSSIMRAFKWVFQNRATKNFQSDFAEGEPTEVTVTFTDGSWVKRFRSETENYYETEDGIYQALRRDVPDEVKDILEMSDINIQNQHDKFFLLQDTAGEVARKLNEETGLSVIDESIKKANSIVTKSKREKEHFEAKVKENEEALSTYEGIEEFSSALNTAAIRIGELSKKERERDKLKGILESLVVVSERIEKKKEFLEIEQPFLDIKNKIDQLESKKKRAGLLSDILSSIKNVEEDISSNKSWLAIEAPYNSLLQKTLQVEEKQKKGLALSTLLVSIDKLEKSIDYKTKKVAVLEMKHKKILQEAGVCPLCGNVINTNPPSHACRG